MNAGIKLFQILLIPLWGNCRNAFQIFVSKINQMCHNVKSFWSFNLWNTKKLKFSNFLSQSVTIVKTKWVWYSHAGMKLFQIWICRKTKKFKSTTNSVWGNCWNAKKLKLTKIFCLKTQSMKNIVRKICVFGPH